MNISGQEHPFDEYIIQGNNPRKQRAENWQIAIGLQDVDRLTNSPYLLATARQHIEGSLDLAAVQQRIEAYYQTEEGRKLAADRTNEADIVATRIMSILENEAFSFIPQEYAQIHKWLFSGVFPHAGRFRTVNISKKEWVLDGESVIYVPAELLEETLEYDFMQEHLFSYQGLDSKETVKHICKFIAALWQIHPFMEGNTRTIAVFTMLYLHKFGFVVSNEPFKQHSWYFRNALVRANYNNYSLGVTATTVFLERFFENMIFQGKNELKSRFCHIQWENDTIPQSATPKCKNCTLEENAILSCVVANPHITQKEMAVQIGKSERTVKSLTKILQEKGRLIRRGGKRKGVWEVLS